MTFVFLTTCNAIALLTTPAAAADNRELATESHRGKTSKVQLATREVIHPATHVLRDQRADRIVVYSATWCGPCQRLKPVLASLQKEGYKVERFDVDGDADKLKYEHRSVPTIYFLRGETVVKKEIGYRSKEQITRMLVSRSDCVPQPTPRDSSDSAVNTLSRNRRF